MKIKNTENFTPKRKQFKLYTGGLAGNDDDNCTRDFVGDKDKSNRKLELIKVDERSDKDGIRPSTADVTAADSDKTIKKTSSDYKMQIRWLNVFIFLHLHMAAVYGCYLLYFKTKWVTFWFSKLIHAFFFVMMMVVVSA